MHIINLLALGAILIAALFGLCFWMIKGDASLYKPKTGISKTRSTATGPSKPVPTQKKIIRLRADDALEKFFCAVAGESFNNEDGSSRQELIKRHGKPGVQIHLEREPGNPHDDAAIAVYLADQQIGYLKSNVAARHAPKIDTGRYALYAEIASVNGGTKKKPNLGVTLEATLFKVRKQ